MVHFLYNLRRLERYIKLLTLYMNSIAFYSGGGGGLKKRPARNVRTFEAFSEHERHPLGVSTHFCEFFIQKILTMFLKVSAFRALRVAP